MEGLTLHLHSIDKANLFWYDIVITTEHTMFIYSR